MKKKLALGLLVTAFMVAIAGCGETKPEAFGGAPAVQGTGNPTGDGPTLVADKPNDDNSKKRKKHPVRPEAPAPAQQQPVTEVPQPQPQPVVAAPKPAPTAIPLKPVEHTVVAMGSTGKKASDFLDQGYDFAILNAKFCSVSGRFPGGSECYLVFSDGKTEWASSNNREAALAFIAELTSVRDAQQQAKKEKKAAKKRKNKE